MAIFTLSTKAKLPTAIALDPRSSRATLNLCFNSKYAAKRLIKPFFAILYHRINRLRRSDPMIKGIREVRPLPRSRAS